MESASLSRLCIDDCDRQPDQTKPNRPTKLFVSRDTVALAVCECHVLLIGSTRPDLPSEIHGGSGQTAAHVW